MDKKVGVGGLARKTEPKRRRSKWEVERRRRHIVLVVISLTIVAALAIIGYGYYVTRIKPWHQPIVKVNDTVFDMDYFVKMLRLYGVSYTDVGSAQQMAQTMIDNELVRQGAEKQFGIVASEEAVNGKIRELFGSEVAEGDFEQNYKEVLASLLKSGLSEADFKRKYVEPEVIRTELLNRIGEEKYPVDEVFSYVHVQAILVVGSDNATAVKERWGEGIGELAQVFSDSQYYPTTDNVEWVPMGIESSAFDSYVFGEGSKEENLGRISDPIEDSEQSGSFWVIQVLGKDDRPLSDNHRDVLVGEASNEWLDNEKKPEVNEVMNYLEGEAGYRRISWALENI